MKAVGARETTRGRVCFVLHSHLPWVLGHGSWPVGEEWLYQAFGHSYIPLLQSLKGLSNRGFRNIASLGITPILAAQLDHPYALSNMNIWLHDWQLRTQQISTSHPARAYMMDQSTCALQSFEHSFSRGISPVVRSLIDSGAMEVLSGPLTHPFTPLLDPRIHRFALREGLKDARRRWGLEPSGIWVPECAYRPGQELVYEELGITHFLVDEPAVTSAGGQANIPYRLAQSETRVIARDLQASDHIWSAERGYPGRFHYQDFHAIDTDIGLRLSRVGDRSKSDKDPYIPDSAHEAMTSDAREFIAQLKSNLDDQIRVGTTNIPLVVIAIDTELLGHWWHEGVTWFTRVIEMLPESGIETVTLSEATRDAKQTIVLGDCSWGEGKDWRIWNSDPVRDLVVMNHQTQIKVLDHSSSPQLHSQLMNEAMLQLSSDWAFMISRNSAADYGRFRAQEHFHRFNELLDGKTPPPSMLPFAFSLSDQTL